MERIVVGVDGSDGSQKALAWALDDARRRGDATVEVVHAWEPPVLVGSPVGAVPPVPIEGPHTDARPQILAHVIAQADTTGVTVEPVVMEGAPGASLCERSQGAALLVLGSSGHGAVLDALIGSVSQYCAHHAASPLVLIPTRRKKR